MAACWVTVFEVSLNTWALFILLSDEFTAGSQPLNSEVEMLYLRQRKRTQVKHGERERIWPVLNGEPDSEDTVLMGNVWNGPVIGVGEPSNTVTKVVVSTPQCLNTLRGRKTRIGRKFRPYAIFLLQFKIACNGRKEKEWLGRWRKRQKTTKLKHSFLEHKDGRTRNSCQGKVHWARIRKHMCTHAHNGSEEEQAHITLRTIVGYCRFLSPVVNVCLNGFCW